MNNEFKKIKNNEDTRYVLENASSGGTSSGSVASVSMPMGSTRKRGDNILAQEADKKTVPVSTPRNFVAKNAKTGGAGQHKDKKKAEKQGDVKHRKPFAEQGMAENDITESEKKGLYYYVNKRKAAGTSRPASSPKAPTAQAWKDAAKTAKKEGVAEDDTATTVHRIQVTVIDPQHPMVSRRDQQTNKIIRITHPDRGTAVDKAIAYYRQQGYKVIDHNYIGPVEQGVAEGFNGEYDDEAGMAHTNLLTSARAVMGLLKTIDDKDNLPEWVQEKIAKAEMMLVGVWDYLQSQKEQGIDPQQGVSEGWDDIKKFGKKAAVAGAIGLGIGAANAGGWSPSDVPAGGHNQLPDIVANVKFKVGDKEVSKEINLGSHYRSPGEAGEELKNFLNSKGIKFYQYSLERVKPKANDKIDNSPATSDMKGSMDTSEPSATGPSTDNYMAKDNDPERGPSMGGKFVKEDPYLESLQSMMERQLEPNMELDTWVDNFQNADPNKYRQFKNKTPEKKKVMAAAALYKARQPKVKKQ